MGRPRSTRAHTEVLDAAQTLFAERGFDATSMDAIAAASGVSKATIYKHWPDKDALCLEVMERIHGREGPFHDLDSGDLRADLAAVLGHRPPERYNELRERIIPHLIAYSARNPEFAQAWRARALTPPQRAGDFAQAMMDLGATICTPKKPACALCPWNAVCRAYARGEAELFPRRIPKREADLRRGAAFLARRADDCVLLRTRPVRGLLGGMAEVPTTEWAADFDAEKALRGAPRFGPSQKRITWRKITGVVRHVFTHFPLELTVYRTEVARKAKAPDGTR